MKFFEVLSLNKAQNIIKECLNTTPLAKKTVPLLDALGLTLAKDIISPEYYPQYFRSTVDGFALCAEDAYCASASVPALLKIVGKVSMGETPDFKISRGNCASIATGALLPEGVNAVVMVENTKTFGDELAVFSPIKVHENIILKGEEISVGDVVAKKGEVISPFLIGILAGIGVCQVEVYDSLKIGIISTGDELVSVNEKAKNGKIRDINTHILTAISKENDFDVVYVARTKDNEDELISALDSAVSKCDLVLISGGSSVGARDFTEKVLKSGEILIHGLALKPGKPTIVATLKGKLVIGLPGNPLASAIVFKNLFVSALNQMRCKEEKYEFAYAKTNFPSTPGRTTIQLVKSSFIDGKAYVEPIFLKSANLFPAKFATGYLIIPEETEGIAKDEIVKVYKL